MHQTLALSSDSSFVCRPQTAGGHSHKAPAISEVMCLPEETGEANSLAKTVTLQPSAEAVMLTSCLRLRPQSPTRVERAKTSVQDRTLVKAKFTQEKC